MYGCDGCDSVGGNITDILQHAAVCPPHFLPPPHPCLSYLAYAVCALTSQLCALTTRLFALFPLHSGLAYLRSFRVEKEKKKNKSKGNDTKRGRACAPFGYHRVNTDGYIGPTLVHMAAEQCLLGLARDGWGRLGSVWGRFGVG